MRAQGDLGSEDFFDHLRSAFVGHGIGLAVVQNVTDYDYNIILTLDSTFAGSAAAAVALDRDGRLIASAVRAGFRDKGAVTGCAQQLAKTIASVLGRS